MTTVSWRPPSTSSWTASDPQRPPRRSELDDGARRLAGQHHGEAVIDVLQRHGVRDQSTEIELAGAPQVGIAGNVDVGIGVAHEHTDHLLATPEPGDR